MSPITNLNPYAKRRVDRGGWFTEPLWEVSYEGQVIRTIRATEDELASAIFLLNTAYQLGYADASAHGTTT